MSSFANKRSYGEAYSVEGLQEWHTHAPMREEDLLTPKVRLNSILAVQALGMALHDQARTTLKSGERKYGFSMLDNSETMEHVEYDGSMEEYMSFRVAKVNHDQWQMRVRFRQNELTRETNRESYIDDYLFDWLRNGNRMAFFTNRRVEKTDGITVEDIREIHPVTDDEVTVLQERMVVHSDKVALSSIGKRF